MQQRLLDVQALDVRLDQLARSRANLPQKAEVARLTDARAAVDKEFVAVETEVADLSKAQRKAEADVEQVRARRVRDEERLNTGQVASPRDLTNLQHEIETLTARQSELEDVELEIMERLEAATTRQEELTGKRAELVTALDGENAELARAQSQIDAEARQVTADRATAAAEIDEPLLARYEKLRAQYGGVGAAALRQRRCEGCRMELDATFFSAVRSAAPETVLRCEECGRILVRVADSGI